MAVIPFSKAIAKLNDLYVRGVITQNEYQTTFWDNLKFQQDQSYLNQRIALWQQACLEIKACPSTIQIELDCQILVEAAFSVFWNPPLERFSISSANYWRFPNREPRDERPCEREVVINAIREGFGDRARNELVALIDLIAATQVRPLAHAATALIATLVERTSGRTRETAEMIASGRHLMKRSQEDVATIHVVVSKSQKDPVQRYRLEFQEILALSDAGYFSVPEEWHHDLKESLEVRERYRPLEAHSLAVALPKSFRDRMKLKFDESSFLSCLTQYATQITPFEEEAYQCTLAHILKSHLIGAETVYELIASGDGHVRRLGIWLAGRVALTPQQIRQIVKSSLNDAWPLVRIAGLELFDASGPTTADADLIEWCQYDYDPAVRAWAAWLVRKARTPNLIRQLLHHVDDESDEVKMAAWWSVSQLTDDEACNDALNHFKERLKSAVASNCPLVAWAAGMAAVRFGKTLGVQPRTDLTD